MTETIKRYILVEVTEENPDGIHTDSGRVRKAIHNAAESHGIHVRDMIYLDDRRTLMASSKGFYHTLRHVMDHTMNEAYRLRDRQRVEGDDPTRECQVCRGPH